MASPSPIERASVLTTAREVVAAVPDGATIGIGGILGSCHPMAIVRELIRAGIGDLHVVGLASGLEVDMLIAAGRVRRVSTPTVSAEARAPIAPAYRHAAQAGELEVWECDETLVYAALRAAAHRVPFTPLPVAIGTSLPQINEGMEEIGSPYGDARLTAVKAIPLDFSFAHAARSDRYGNVQVIGSGYGDRALARAAARAVYTVDRVVTNHEVRMNPDSTAIAGVDAVVQAPFGAHPFASPGHYIADDLQLDDYLAACSRWIGQGDRGQLDAFFERWVSGPEDHWDYLARVGPERLHGLEEGLR